MYDTFQLLYDPKGTYWPYFYDNNPKLFQDYNQRWYGIFKTVNWFDATEEQIKASGQKTKRQKIFLKKLRYVYCDLDIAKKWDWQTKQEKDAKKAIAYWELVNKLEPTLIIETANWLQPLWRINEDKTDLDTQDIYCRTIAGISERTKTIWWAGDCVKDVTRILRVPWYYHMKAEPIMVVKHEWINDMTYSLFDIYRAFHEYIPPPKEIKAVKISTYKPKEWEFSLDNIDITQIFERLLQSQWRSLEFDKTRRAIIDWRLTWTHQGKTWDRQFIASNSHEPFAGNKITLVASTLWVSNKDAYKWIKEHFMN